MNQSDEQREQDESTEVEGHLRHRGRADEPAEDVREGTSQTDEDGPDVEGHLKRPATKNRASKNRA